MNLPFATKKKQARRLPSISLQTRKQEAITILNLIPRTTTPKDAAPQELVSIAEEDVPEDVPRMCMFNSSTEVDPLECPSVTIFDDDDHENQLDHHYPLDRTTTTSSAIPWNPNHNNKDESKFQQDEIDSLNPLFVHYNELQENTTSNAMVPQYVQFPGTNTRDNNKNDGDYFFSTDASNDHDRHSRSYQELEALRRNILHGAAPAYSLNDKNDSFHSQGERLRSKQAADSSSTWRHMPPFLQENNNSSTTMCSVGSSSTTTTTTTAFHGAQEQTFHHFFETPLAVELAGILADQGIQHLNWQELQALTRLLHAQCYDSMCACMDSTSSTAGTPDAASSSSRDYCACRK